jgi:hypothetical protein
VASAASVVRSCRKIKSIAIVSASQHPQVLKGMTLLDLLSQLPQEFKYLELSGFRRDATGVPYVATPNQRMPGIGYVFSVKGQLKISRVLHVSMLGVECRELRLSNRFL